MYGQCCMDYAQSYGSVISAASTTGSASPVQLPVESYYGTWHLVSPMVLTLETNIKGNFSVVMRWFHQMWLHHIKHIQYSKYKISSFLSLARQAKVILCLQHCPSKVACRYCVLRLLVRPTCMFASAISMLAKAVFLKLVLRMPSASHSHFRH